MNRLLAAMGFAGPKGSPDLHAGGFTLPGGGLLAIHEPTFRALLEQWQSMAPSAVMPRSSGSQAVPMKRGNVAVVQMDGPMSRGGTPCFGAGSTVDFRTALRAAERDAEVTDVVAVIDSPGGTVAGTGDAGDEIRRVMLTKPVHVYVPDMCASAGYWLASQATSVWASPNATTIGNVNARRTLINVSESLRKAGVEVTILKGKRGTFKDAGDGSKPFTEEEIAYLQGEIDRMEAAFAAAVARGRGVSLAKALEWSDGRWFDAPTALKMGLIDRTGTLDELMESLLVALDPKSFDQPAPGGSEDVDPDAIARTDPAQDRLRFVADAASVLFGAKVPSEPLPANAAMALPLLPPPSGLAPAAPIDGAPTISAPGGQPGSAGTNTAPPQGAEKNTGKKPMRQDLINAFAGENMGVFVSALQGTTSDNPELLARIISGSAKAQIEAATADNPVIALARTNGITDAAGLTAALSRAKDGDTYLSDLRSEAKKEAVRAFGDNGAMVGAAVDHQTLPQVKISRDAWRATADATFGHGADGSAPARQTAPSGTVRTSQDVQTVSARPFDKLDATMKARVKTQAAGDAAREDALAADYLKNMGGEA